MGISQSRLIRAVTAVGAVGAVGAVAVLGAAPVSGQEAVTVDSTCVCLRASEAPGWRSFETVRRARLGVMLGEPAEVDGRTGVRLEDVADGSPAARAGLREADVVVALDGRALGQDPTAALLDFMEDVEPGDTIAVTFLRDGDERTARVTTESRSIFAFDDGRAVRFRAPAAIRAARGAAVLAPTRLPGVERARAGMLYRNLLRGGLGLAAVNPALGSYFGTDQGVLVTDVAADSPLNLRPGDVILAIGGRDVEDPAHARAILASYRDDEEISFRVVREKRTVEVTGRRS